MKVIKNESIANLERVEDVQPVEDVVMADARQFSNKVSQKSVLERVEEIVGKEAFLGAKKQPTPEKVETPKPLLLDESLFEDYVLNESDYELDESDNVLEEDILDEMANYNGAKGSAKKANSSSRDAGAAYDWYIAALIVYYACVDPSGPQLNQVPSSSIMTNDTYKYFGLVNIFKEIIEKMRDEGGEGGMKGGNSTSINSVIGYSGLYKLVDSALIPYQEELFNVIPSTEDIPIDNDSKVGRSSSGHSGTYGHFPNVGVNGSKPLRIGNVFTGLVPGPRLNDFMRGRNAANDPSKFHMVAPGTTNQKLGNYCDIDFINNPHAIVDAPSQWTAERLRDEVIAIINANPDTFNCCKGMDINRTLPGSAAGNPYTSVPVKAQQSQQTQKNTSSAKDDDTKVINKGNQVPPAAPAENEIPDDLISTTKSFFDDIDFDDEDDDEGAQASNEALEENTKSICRRDVSIPKLKNPSLSMQIDKQNDAQKVEEMQKAFRKEKRLEECCDITDDMYDYKTVQKLCCLNSWAPEQFKYYVFDRIDL